MAELLTELRHLQENLPRAHQRAEYAESRIEQAR